MKKIITTLFALLVFSLSVNAFAWNGFEGVFKSHDRYQFQKDERGDACDIEIREDYNHWIGIAKSHMLRANNLTALDNIDVKIGHIENAKDYGRTNIVDYINGNRWIQYDRRLCGETHDHISFIVAHEIGHLVSVIHRPEIATGVISGEEITDDMYELYADNIAAWMFFYDNKDITPVLAVLEERCQNGKSYSCIREDHVKSRNTELF